MQVNQAKYDENHSDSIMNVEELWVEPSERDLYLLPYKTKRQLGITTLQLLKRVFGRQQTTKNYSHRNWIWTFTQNGSVLYCMVSVEGISWEYDSRSNSKEIVVLFKKVVAILQKGKKYVS